MATSKRSKFLFSTPQLARQWATGSFSAQDAVPAVKAQVSSVQRPKSRRRNGRKIGKAEAMQRRAREGRTRAGEIKEYSLSLVHRERVLDPHRTMFMANEEASLWAELSYLHTRQLTRSNLTGAALKMSKHEANEVYSSQLSLRMQDAQTNALACLCNTSCTEAARMLEFHALRRVLSILQQEYELIYLDDCQARAVGEDGAFIAAGRSIKQRSFAARFGWWHPRQLLDMHGRLTDEDEAFLEPDVLLAEAAAEVFEADEQTAALFDAGEKDDWDVDMSS